MAVNKYGQTYVGNDDFRGWLASGAADGIQLAYDNGQGLAHVNTAALLKDVGNDGKSKNQISNELGTQLYGIWSNQRDDNLGSGTGSAYGGSYSGSGISSAERQAIRAEKDRDLTFLQSLYDSLGGRESTAKSGVDRNYNTSLGSLTTQRDEAYQNLDREGEKIDKQKTKGLSSLGDDIRSLIQGTNNQLGMYGAGSSSATDMLSYGAANLQNSASGDITDQYNEQVGDIDLNRHQFGRKYDDEKLKLDDWKRDKYTDIKNTFADQRNDLLNQMNKTESNYQKALAGAGIAAPGVDSSINSRLSQITNTFKDTSAPQVGFGELSPYQAGGINRASVANSVLGPQLSQAQVMQYLTPKKSEEERKY